MILANQLAHGYVKFLDASDMKRVTEKLISRIFELKLKLCRVEVAIELVRDMTTFESSSNPS